MGWSSRNDIEQFIAMSKAERESLTWEQDRWRFFDPDTLHLAGMGGAERAGMKLCEYLEAFYRIPPVE